MSDRKPRTVKRWIKPNIGADPELFVINKTGNVVPGSDLVSDPSYGSAQIVYDNAAIELRPRAEPCIEYFLSRRGGSRGGRYNLDELIRRLKKIIDDPSNRGHLASLSPAYDMSRYKLDHAEGCNEFGCDPTLVFTADETVVENTPKVDPEETTLRSVGYHIHIGELEAWKTSYAPPSDKRKLEFVHDLESQIRMTGLNDLYLGLFGVLMEQDWAKAARLRRDTIGYGVAGEFRQQPHGYEYRTLGPWPIRSPIWAWWAASASRCVAFLVKANADTVILPQMDRAAVVEAINQCDEEAALDLWNKARRLLIEYYNEHGHYLAHTNDALHPRGIKAMEWAVASGQGRKCYLTDTRKYNPGNRQVENMWNAWSTFKDHNSMCFPDTYDRVWDQDEDMQEFCNSWSNDRDNIREWRGE